MYDIIKNIVYDIIKIYVILPYLLEIHAQWENYIYIYIYTYIYMQKRIEKHDTYLQINTYPVKYISAFLIIAFLCNFKLISGPMHM